LYYPKNVRYTRKLRSLTLDPQFKVIMVGGEDAVPTHGIYTLVIKDFTKACETTKGQSRSCVVRTVQ
jgi:hypothetical protein